MARDGFSTNFDSEELPFSLEAEQAVLGCILIDATCLSQVTVILRPEYFYLPQHRAIFSTMLMLDMNNQSVDALVVLEHLKSENVYDDAGGKTYLYQLAQVVPSVSNVESYANIVREKYYVRTLISTAREMIDSAQAQQERADVILDSAEQKIYDIRRGKDTNAPSKIGDILIGEVLDRLRQLSSSERDKYKGVPTGFTDLDKAVSGLNRSDLIIVGARPAMGKTSFALNMARNVAVVGKRKVLMFSLEMTKMQLAQRILATEARVNVSKMRSGEIDDSEWDRLGVATGVLNKAELYFDDTSGITVPEMKSKIRRLGGVECVIVDYLGLVRSATKTENRVQEVSEITRSLKLLAKDLDIPVVVCSQLSRAGTEGKGKQHRPQLADLRESGSIEQDADIVLMLYRPNYYATPDSAPAMTPEEQEEYNKAEVIISKNRHGPTKTIDLHWNPDFTLFTTPEKIRRDM